VRFAISSWRVWMFLVLLVAMVGLSVNEYIGAAAPLAEARSLSADMRRIGAEAAQGSWARQEADHIGAQAREAEAYWLKSRRNTTLMGAAWAVIFAALIAFELRRRKPQAKRDQTSSGGEATA